MANSVFQSVILQLKDVSDRVYGVLDTEGCVISCTDATMLGECWSDAVVKVNGSLNSVVTFNQKSFKAILNSANYLEYVAFCTGSDEMAKVCCQVWPLPFSSCSVI